MAQNTDAESIVRDIERPTRKKYSSEEKIRIVLEGLRGEASVAQLRRREGLNTNIYYKWSKEFLEAGKKRLQGDTFREATSTEVVGNSSTRRAILKGMQADAIVNSWLDGLEAFEAIRRKYLLYR